MRAVIIFISLVFSIDIFGQSIPDIQHLLLERKVKPLKTYIDSANRRVFSIRWETLREIVDGNQEGVIKIEILKELDSIGNVDNYSIQLLANHENIFFYELTHWKFKRVGKEQYDSYPIILSSYKDSNAYYKFQNAFRKTYNDALDEKDLFETSIVYGNGCGIVGTPPEYQVKFDSLLASDDIATIHSWLKSPNAEKQVYAIQGLKMLVKKGYTLTPEDLKIIEEIRQKKANINICNGCIYSSDAIKNVIDRIYSSPRANKKNRLLYWGLTAFIVIVALTLFYNSRMRQKGGVQQ